MDEYKPLYSKSPCPCRNCKGPRQLVLSRPRGFVSQNCLNFEHFEHCEYCKRPKTILLRELPERLCDECGTHLLPVVESDKNYWYKCETCQISSKVASIVPLYSELFPYCGLGLESDNFVGTVVSEVPLPRGAKIEYLPNSLK